MAFEELKAKQSVMWANGPYQNVTETLTDLQDLTVSRLGPGPGVHWLDLACGTGAIAERAASAGSEVVGIDLSPGLIETAQERAKQLGLSIDYRVGDCENLDVGDASFDVVSSTCGVMFAPDHEATARELARVVKPGGKPRTRQLDTRGRGRGHVPRDGPVPARAAAQQPVRLGQAGPRP